ncbi:unnamed protein product [Symbiodinium sp. CCMP2592]|nr:unnamed protein product [Symbiodinium sp. CCMP2592]
MGSPGWAADVRLRVGSASPQDFTGILPERVVICTPSAQRSRSFSPRTATAGCSSGLAASSSVGSPVLQTPMLATAVEGCLTSPCHRYVQPAVRQVVRGSSSPCRYTIVSGERRCYSPQVVRTYQASYAIPQPPIHPESAASRAQVWPHVVQGVNCILGDAGVPPPPLKNPTLSILIRDFEMENPGLPGDWESDLGACGRCAKHISSMLLELALGDRILVPLAPGGPSVPVSKNGPQGQPSQTWQQAFAAYCPALQATLRQPNAAEVESCFAQASCSSAGSLGWRTGEVQRFMRLCFDSLGLPPPLCHPAVWYQMLREMTTDPAARLAKERASEFLHLFLERLLSFQLAQQETQRASQLHGSSSSVVTTKAEARADVVNGACNFAASPDMKSFHLQAPVELAGACAAVKDAAVFGLLADAPTKVRLSSHIKMDDGCSVPSTMTPGSGNGVEPRRVLEDVIQLQSASASAASPVFTLPVASPPRQAEARKSPKAPSPGAGEIPSPSFQTKGRCAATYSFGPLTFAKEEFPVLASPPQPQELQRPGFATLETAATVVPSLAEAQFSAGGALQGAPDFQQQPTESRREPYEAEVCRLLEAVQGACTDLAQRLEHQRQAAVARPAPGAQWYDMSTPALPPSTSGSLLLSNLAGDDLVEDPCPMLRPPDRAAVDHSQR